MAVRTLSGICFMLKSTRTIRREIFAPAFHDRVVHHIITTSLRLYERRFIAIPIRAAKGRAARYAVGSRTPYPGCSGSYRPAVVSARTFRAISSLSTGRAL